jgi:hypothetical protein
MNLENFKKNEEEKTQQKQNNIFFFKVNEKVNQTREEEKQKVNAQLKEKNTGKGN